MKNRKYIGVPTQKEINSQFTELHRLIKDISTIEQARELASNHPNIDVEINGDSLDYYKGEAIETIRYEYKNILVYSDIKNNTAKVCNCITLYSDDGLQIGDSDYYDFSEEIEEAAKMGLLEKNTEFKFKAVLWMVELEDGLSKEQISNMLELIEDDSRGYMPIEIHDNNSSAYGFISSSYYESISYNIDDLSKVIKPVLNDWANESADNIYTLKDGTKIYMGCDHVTI